jgi:Mn-containing catalase
MTKKHFEMIAEVIAMMNLGVDKSTSAATKNHVAGIQCARASIARELARQFSSENPRFDRARFLKACKVEA